MFDTKAPIPKALVIHPNIYNKKSGLSYNNRLEEAVGLSIALGLEIVYSSIENLREINVSTFFGSGKIEELRDICEELNCDIVVIDDNITPVQQRNLEKKLHAKVIDRTGLILEIFSLRARTKEGKLQVELARLTYERSRLVRTWTHLERQRGGTGKTGGPGERQIELDRRLIANNIVKLKAELEEVRRTRKLQRSARNKVPYPIIALVGYTNAGKSTLFNTLTNADVFAKDMLFATLDTTSRKVKTPKGREVIISDTVGFISDLPTQLIAAFRATLEEVTEADILLHVRDISSQETLAQKNDVDEILNSLLEKQDLIPPIIEVWNKIDNVPPEEFDNLQNQIEAIFKKSGDVCVITSAINSTGLDNLLNEIDKELEIGLPLNYIICPKENGQLLAWLYKKGAVNKQFPLENGDIALEINLSKSDKGIFYSKFGNIVELEYSQLSQFGLKP